MTIKIVFYCVAEETRKEEPTKKEEPAKRQEISREEGERIKVSPYAKKTAEEQRVDLHGVKGSGAEGRIRKHDVDAALGNFIARFPS